MKLILPILLAASLLSATSASALTDAQKCSSFKWKVAGGHAECLLKEDAKAIKTGKEPDYSSCERKLTIKYTRAELKWACDVEGEVAEVLSLLGTCTAGVGDLQGDGIVPVVAVESGWVCSGPAPGGCHTICGDGVVAGSEVCDDGNTEDGDGCNEDCLFADDPSVVMAGWWDFTFEGMSWPARVSPDGSLMVMRNVFGLGCSSTCLLDVNFTDYGQALSSLRLTPIAGNAPFCRVGSYFDVEMVTGYRDWYAEIWGEPKLRKRETPDQTCSPLEFPLPVCGDGTVESPEVCDDGNQISGDGCRADCFSADAYCANLSGVFEHILPDHNSQGEYRFSDNQSGGLTVEYGIGATIVATYALAYPDTAAGTTLTEVSCSVEIELPGVPDSSFCGGTWQVESTTPHVIAHRLSSGGPGTLLVRR